SFFFNFIFHFSLYIIIQVSFYIYTTFLRKNQVFYVFFYIFFISSCLLIFCVVVFINSSSVIVISFMYLYDGIVLLISLIFDQIISEISCSFSIPYISFMVSLSYTIFAHIFKSISSSSSGL